MQMDLEQFQVVFFFLLLLLFFVRKVRCENLYSQIFLRTKVVPFNM